MLWEEVEGDHLIRRGTDAPEPDPGRDADSHQIRRQRHRRGRGQDRLGVGWVKGTQGGEIGPKARAPVSVSLRGYKQSR